MNNIKQTNAAPGFFMDNFHYSYEFADLILMQLLTGVPTDEKYRGELVNKSNLEAYITKVENRLSKLNSVQCGLTAD